MHVIRKMSDKTVWTFVVGIYQNHVFPVCPELSQKFHDYS